MPEAWHQRLAMGDEREMGEKHAVPEQGKATALDSSQLSHASLELTLTHFS